MVEHNVYVNINGYSVPTEIKEECNKRHERAFR